MAKARTQKEALGDLQKFRTVLSTNKDQIPHLQGTITTFEGMLDTLVETTGQQANLMAGKQELSKKIQMLLTETQRLANVLRAALKAHFGIRSEKLTEFGLQPFRGRSRKGAPGEVETPEVGGAARKTDSPTDSTR